MVKKTIKKTTKSKSQKDALVQFTGTGHIKNMVTSHINISSENSSVTLVFDDGVEIRLEFKTEGEAESLVECITQWNGRSSIHKIELVYNPKKKKDIVVKTWAKNLMSEKIFTDSRKACEYFEKIESLTLNASSEKTMFQLYSIPDVKGVNTQYWLRTNALEIDFTFSPETKVFVNSVQKPIPDFEPGFIWA